MTTRDGSLVRVRKNNSSIVVALPRDQGWQAGDLARWDGSTLVRVRVVPLRGVR